MYRAKASRKFTQFQPYNHPSSPNRPSLLKVKNHGMDIDKRQYKTVMDDVLIQADAENLKRYLDRNAR